MRDAPQVIDAESGRIVQPRTRRPLQTTIAIRREMVLVYLKTKRGQMEPERGRTLVLMLRQILQATIESEIETRIAVLERMNGTER